MLYVVNSSESYGASANTCHPMHVNAPHVYLLVLNLPDRKGKSWVDLGHWLHSKMAHQLL